MVSGRLVVFVTGSGLRAFGRAGRGVGRCWETS